MIHTKILIGQHDAAMTIAQRLLFLIDSYHSSEDAFAIALQLAKLFGLLRMHLAHEDTELYPSLATCADPEVADLARAYMMEMGSLAETFEQFALRWSSSAVIATGFEQCRAAAFDLIAALELRIERENVYLYPLVALVTSRKNGPASRATPAPPPLPRPIRR